MKTKNIITLMILAGLIAGPVYAKYDNDQKKSRALQDLEKIISELDSYALENDGYPSSNQGLSALNNKYTDPWGNQYKYKSSGIFDCKVVSLGADGVYGGQGSDQDIIIER